MSEHPPRYKTDPTLVIDRSKLAPIQRAIIERAASLYPDHLPPDLIVTDAPEDEEVPATEVHCPSCQNCKGCGGRRMVSVERRSELLRKETGL